MKFAKTLEDLMVPEWRTQYVEYKVGKKRIKATTNNLRNATPSPALTSLRRTASRVSGTGGVGGGGEPKSGGTTPIGRVRGLSILRRSTSLMSRSPNLERTPRSPGAEAEPEVPPPVTFQERSPLQPTPVQRPQTAASSIAAPARRPSVNYGSSGFSPSFSLPKVADENHMRPPKPPSLQLPDPIQPFGPPGTYDGEGISRGPSAILVKSAPVTGPSVEAGRPVLARSESKGSMMAANPPLLKRIFTLGRTPVVPPCSDEPTIEEVQATAEKEFLSWLLGQLKKCEDFYIKREMESSQRFDDMREQLDTMRERWFKAKHNIPFEEDDVEDVGDDEATSGLEAYDSASVDTTIGPKKRVGWKTFAEAMNGLTRPHPTIAQVNTAVMHHGHEGTRDYVRHLPVPTRKPLNNPAHRVAKRKLKRAYIEYYHGLEMLKSYVTVNRECFRKITKKFDKASGLRTSHRFMTAYVDKSKFGGADNDLDDMLNDTEVLFARFFERGNRKEASARLRSRESKTVYYRAVWMTGFYLGCALVIGVYGLYNAMILLYDKNQPERALRTSYLLQVCFRSRVTGWVKADGVADMGWCCFATRPDVTVRHQSTSLDSQQDQLRLHLRV
ncbi:SPX domain-containing protein [Tricharina praecox]|uniref:SPX domain-containing protein n=1 Tax=Tricharina praecox TaxID=43433 RepID=UPI00221EEA3F|nr:SPX domain-containing protein [Tricharina praecox]KAI5844190.1 SPX domain-containing protein [Tricharina praecox]